MHPITSAAAAFAAAVTIAATAGAQTADPALEARLRLADAWLERQMLEELIPGASIALVRGQALIWSAGYGYADREGAVPATPQTAYSVCSISKLFTSVAVMTLVEDGRMDLDAPLAEYVPELDLPAAGDVIAEPITVRGALSHAAGLPREGATPYWVEVDFPDRDTLLEGLSQQARLYTPFDTWQYSNLGMSLLGEAVERVSGEAYDSYVRGAVLEPLGLDAVTTDLPMNADGGRFAAGYWMHDAEGGRERVAPYTLNAVAPAAGFAASVSDLARFASWQFALLDSGDGPVLDRAALREMHRVQWADPNDPDSPMWGLGFQHSRLDGDAVLGHGGYCPGYRADFRMRLPDRIAVAAMVNANDISPAMLSEGVYAITKAALTAEDPPAELAFAEYEGVFGRARTDRHVYALPTADSLMLVSLFSDDPMQGATRLEHVEGDVFRRKREEGGLGETIRFERDSEGRITRMWRHGNYMERLDDA